MKTWSKLIQSYKPMAMKIEKIYGLVNVQFWSKLDFRKLEEYLRLQGSGEWIRTEVIMLCFGFVEASCCPCSPFFNWEINSGITFISKWRYDCMEFKWVIFDCLRNWWSYCELVDIYDWCLIVVVNLVYGRDCWEIAEEFGVQT